MKKVIKEQTGAGAACGTTTATFQPAVGPNGSASNSGAFPGNVKKKKKGLRRRKTEQLIRRQPPTIAEAVKLNNRMKKTSIKSN